MTVFWVLLVILVIVVLLAVVAIVGFNKLRRSDIHAQEALGGIDVQLTRRAELIPNLVSTVQGYATHERGVFEAVTAARTRVAAAAQGGTVGEKSVADSQLQNALGRLFAVAEGYPELRASQNFLDLQRQLADTENQLATARQYYNDSVNTLNTAVATIPWMLFAGTAGVSAREFYKAPEGATAPPSVRF